MHIASLDYCAIFSRTSKRTANLQSQLQHCVPTKIGHNSQDSWTSAGSALSSAGQLPKSGCSLILAWLNSSKSGIGALFILALVVYAVFFPHPERGPREIANEIIQARGSEFRGQSRETAGWQELHKQYVEEIKLKVARKEVIALCALNLRGGRNCPPRNLGQSGSEGGHRSLCSCNIARRAGNVRPNARNGGGGNCTSIASVVIELLYVYTYLGRPLAVL